MKKAIILGAGIYQYPLIKKAKEMGIYTIVISINGNYPGFKIADKIYYEDTTDIDKVIEIARAEKISAIMTSGTDVPIITLGKVCDELHLPGVSYEAAKLTTDKYLMKEAFIENNVRTAKFIKVFSIEDAYTAYNSLNKPVIFKAIDSSGSRGIKKVNSVDEVSVAYDIVQKTTRKEYFIVEEYIEGEEFGAQAFIQNGKLEFVLPHGDFLFEGDTGVPIGHFVPIKSSDKIIQDTSIQIDRCIKALKIDNCAINADFIIKDNEVYVLEIGARAGATCLVELVSIYYNFDYYKKIIDVAFGEKVDFSSEFTTPNASKLLISNKTGILKGIILPSINKNIYETLVDYEIGEKVNKFNVGPDRIGHIITKGETLDEALKILNDYISKVRIEIE